MGGYALGGLWTNVNTVSGFVGNDNAVSGFMNQWQCCKWFDPSILRHSGI
jgi:hypothetical protein